MSGQWIWVKSDTQPKCKPTNWQKQAIVADAEKFVGDFYRPQFLRLPPAEARFNYVTDFSVCFNGSYLRFTAKYACPGPNAVSPSFDHHFARLGYFGPDRFNLWARRHNDEWIVIGSDLTLEGCFAEMRANPWFHF